MPAAAPAPTTVTASSAEVAGYLQRRKRARPVVGGCEESCERPEKALSALIDALDLADPEARVEALWPRFETSQLVVDGEARGERWAELWQDVRDHQRREAEIGAFLREVAGLRDQLAAGAAMAELRGAGTELRAIPGRPDLHEVRLRLARLQAAAAPAWRLVLLRRGWEWLVVELDRDPGRRPLQPGRYSGSAVTGRL